LDGVEEGSEAERGNAGETADAEAGTGTETDAVGGVEKIAGVNIQRYKGLGEMNAEQLWETTMDPDNRIFLQVMASDAQKANDVFDVLMGSEVLPRKKFN